MKNKKLKIALLMALFSQAAYSVDVVLKPFGSTNATVSSKEPNIINVKNDTIVRHLKWKEPPNMIFSRTMCRYKNPNYTVFTGFTKINCINEWMAYFTFSRIDSLLTTGALQH